MHHMQKLGVGHPLIPISRGPIAVEASCHHLPNQVVALPA